MRAIAARPETREPLVSYNAAGEANAPMLAYAAAAKKAGAWPFFNMNRTHFVPPCNVSESEVKEGLAALDAALTVADEYTDQPDPSAGGVPHAGTAREGS